MGEETLESVCCLQAARLVAGAQKLSEMGMDETLAAAGECSAAKAVGMLRTLLARLSRSQPSEARYLALRAAECDVVPEFFSCSSRRQSYRIGRSKA